MPEIPAAARIVIIGGGIVGCATAYHLARAGAGDVLLLERHRLTSGSTFHAAGLVGQLRSSAAITRLLGRSVALYRRLEAETGLATGWKMNGGLRLACNQERWSELRRQATTARSFGLEMHLLTPAEAKRLWPLMETADLVGAAFLPTDGQVNPSDVTAALARGARTAGVRILEDCEVTGIEIARRRPVAVRTREGRIACEIVVDCAGRWAREVGAMADITVPLVALRHQYLITEPIPGTPRDLPTLRDPDRLTYYKEEVGGLVAGGYEPDPQDWSNDGAPDGEAFRLLEPDWDHFQPMMENLIARVPALANAGIRQLLNGPESFTPDGNFILGEAPGLAGFFVAAGFNAFGIAAGGGAGEALAAWILDGAPPFDLWPADIRRFGRNQADLASVRTRTREMYGRHYAIAFPQAEFASARPLRRSALYATLAARGAVFGEKLGWERPNWFARPGEEAHDVPSFARPNWFAAVGREHRAARERAALFDQSSFAKFLMIGRDAEEVLDFLAAGDLRSPPGRITYTQLLDEKGGIQCDLTATRLAPDRYLLVTGTASATRDFDWIARHIPAGSNAHLVDVTSAYATLALMGPRARDILARLTRADLANAAFPFGTAREIPVAGAPVIALRITYVGELGYELHVPTEFALTLYEALLEAGAPLGLQDAGYRAIETLRLEKFYRAWGAEVGPDTTPLEAGLAWALKRDRPFLGAEALATARTAPLGKFLCGFTADPSVTLLGRETILRDGNPVGWLTSGGFGHTIDRAIGYGYVRRPEGVSRAWLEAGHYSLEVERAIVPCRLHLSPPVDPRNEKVKA